MEYFGYESDPTERGDELRNFTDELRGNLKCYQSREVFGVTDMTKLHFFRRGALIAGVIKSAVVP
jgi:hypothetical protein